MYRLRKPLTCYVALLRGINVGGNCRVEMKQLQALCEALGYVDVMTYINSGNVIFSSSKTAAAILRELEPALEKTFLFHIPTLLRTKQELQTIVDEVPKKWVNDSDQKTDVLFLWPTYNNKKTLQLIAQQPKVDELRYVSGAIIWHIDRGNITQSKMRDFIGTSVYKHMTARNINTVRKLVALMTSIKK